MISHLSENALLDFILFISIFMEYQGSVPDSAVIITENEKVDTFSMLAMKKQLLLKRIFNPFNSTLFNAFL